MVLNGGELEGRRYLSKKMIEFILSGHAVRMGGGTTIANTGPATVTPRVFGGRYDEASSWAEEAFQDQPNFPLPARIAAASHALAGRIAEAQKFITQVRKLGPALRTSNLKNLYPLRRSEDFLIGQMGCKKQGCERSGRL